MRRGVLPNCEFADGLGTDDFLCVLWSDCIDGIFWEYGIYIRKILMKVICHYWKAVIIKRSGIITEIFHSIG